MLRTLHWGSRTIVSALISVACVGILFFLWTQDALPASKLSFFETAADLQPPAVFKLHDSLFPVLQVDSNHTHQYWIAHNQRSFRALIECLGNPPFGCAQNQTKVVILDSFHFSAVLEGHSGGKEVWARSTVQALENMGYTFFYTEGLRMRHSVQLYRMFPNLVKAIFVEGEDAQLCLEDVTCALSEHNPGGIPAWKLLSFSWRERSASPLGPKWTLSPEDYRLERNATVPNTYLGYSVEPGCLSHPFIPRGLRAKPPQAYVHAKDITYFSAEHHAWKADFYDAAAAETGAHFLVGAFGTAPSDFPKSVENVGLLPLKWFYQSLAESSVLVGVGLPGTSPTPYDALCLGVPYINPILEWDEHDPTNRTAWTAQHEMLKNLDPPHVYNIFKGDKEGFTQAVKAALAHPIQSYTLEHMRMRAVELRLGNILETDWKADAQLLLRERMSTGDGDLFMI